MAHEKAEAVARALERLPEDYRRVITLRNQERRDFDEIGRLMNRSTDAARRLWSRAIERLERELARLLPAGLSRNLLGPRLIDGPIEPVSRRLETAQGWTVEAMHDAYVADLGLRHERQITMSPQGLMLTGRDRLVPADGHSAKGIHFAVRFHIHPDVRVSRLDGGGILLKLSGGEGWRFRAGGGALEIEESVYLGGSVLRRAEQLVVSGTIKDSPTEIAWVFEQIVA